MISATPGLWLHSWSKLFRVIAHSVLEGYRQRTAEPNYTGNRERDGHKNNAV